MIHRISAYQLVYIFPVNFSISDEFSEMKLCTPEEAKSLNYTGKIAEHILNEYLLKLGVYEDDSDSELKK